MHAVKGLSLLEILIVIGILILLAGLGAGSLPLFKKTTDLNSSVENGVSLLLQARSKTLSSQEESQYGVRFESGRMTLFRGHVFSSGDPQNQESILPSSVEISDVLLNGGGSDVVFERLTGETIQYGTITFRLTSDTLKTRVITIGSTGVVSVE